MPVSHAACTYKTLPLLKFWPGQLCLVLPIAPSTSRELHPATMETSKEKAPLPDDKRGSIVEADVHSLGHDHGAESELRRMLGTRHLTMIALGSSIGMGLWLGSGTSLVNGGPAGIFIGYILAGSMIWSVSHSIGEMAIMYPLPSAYVQWTSKFICPSAAFALGWSYWFSYVITIANELAVSKGDSRSNVAHRSLILYRLQTLSWVSGPRKFLSPGGSLSSGLSSSQSTSAPSHFLERLRSSHRPLSSDGSLLSSSPSSVSVHIGDIGMEGK